MVSAVFGKGKFAGSVIFCLLAAVGCSEQQKTTPVAAATGGALGAGLGALIGNQTGDAGGGFVIGALAGSGAGAAVGHMLDERDLAIRQQDEALGRQEQMIQAQRSQIDELRRLSGDSVRFRGDSAFDQGAAGFDAPTYQRSMPSDRTLVDPRSLKVPGQNTGAYQPQSASVKEQSLVEPVGSDSFNANSAPSTSFRSSGFDEAIAVQPSVPEVVGEEPAIEEEIALQESEEADAYAAAMNREVESEAAPSPSQAEQALEMETEIITEQAEAPQPASLSAPTENRSVECQSAEREAMKADSASETADKLFYYRRALRLCPSDPAYHTKIGEVYLSLGRVDDARFEFEEALRLNPGYASARKNLSSLSQTEAY